MLKHKNITFMEGFHLVHWQSSLREGRPFHYKVPFSLTFISLKKILQWVKSRARMFNAFYFSCYHFKLWKRNKLILHFLEKIRTDPVAQKCSLIEKCVLRNFAKLTGKHLCQSLFSNKVAGLRPATLLKKRPWHRWFSVNFAKSLRASFLIEHIRLLLV